MAINTPAWAEVRAALTEDADALAAFTQIEQDVERLIQELEGAQIAERDLRTALGEPAGAETQRR